jgi:hypothetical protein
MRVILAIGFLSLTSCGKKNDQGSGSAISSSSSILQSEESAQASEVELCFLSSDVCKLKSSYGSTTNLQYDLNGDQVVSAADLLLLLPLIKPSCPPPVVAELDVVPWFNTFYNDTFIGGNNGLDLIPFVFNGPTKLNWQQNLNNFEVKWIFRGEVVSERKDKFAFDEVYQTGLLCSGTAPVTVQIKDIATGNIFERTGCSWMGIHTDIPSTPIANCADIDFEVNCAPGSFGAEFFPSIVNSSTYPFQSFCTNCSN